MSRQQMLNLECCLGDQDQIDYNILEGSEQQFRYADLQYSQIDSDIESRKNCYRLAWNSYEQPIQDLNSTEQESKNESKFLDSEYLQWEIPSQNPTIQSQQLQQIRQIQEEQFSSGQQELKCQLTNYQNYDPQELNTYFQDDQSSLQGSINQFNNEQPCQNSYVTTQFIDQYEKSEPIENPDNDLNKWKTLNESNKYKHPEQQLKCRKQQKYNKVNDKQNNMITKQNQLCIEKQDQSESQDLHKNINQDKYKKIIQRLQQRDVKHVQSTILFQNTIMETLADRLKLEKYEKQINGFIEQDSKQIKVDIIQSLYSDFSEFQDQIVGLGQIEKYIVLLVVKLGIYNFIQDKNLLDGEQFQHNKDDLLYFFTSLSDRKVIMEQAKDFIIEQKIFKLSRGVKNKITKKLMNQLCIYRQYYKSNQSGYSNYIKQSKKVIIKNEEYMSFDKNKDRNKSVFFGKKNFIEIIKNDQGTIKDFTINHHYSILNQNQGKVEKLSIYMDDIFNLLILFEDL
ncbi:hypothetical protein pb186bvf_002718 [Paramecium bursaria]